ncbi:MAG TPA: porin family protein [Fibrobacteraceae bacterium]|nr:porin family protein [Fibrobacteraceae bacterium]
MNKILMSFMVLAMLATTSFAQNVGGHLALNFGTTIGEYNEDVSWGLGVNAGVAAKFTLIPMLDLAPEIDFEMRRASDDDVTWTTMAINIPVLLRVNVMPQLFLEVGPTVAFLLSSEMETEVTELGDVATVSMDLGSDEIDVLETFELGLAAGAGFTVMPKLDLNFRVAMGLTSLVSDDFGEAKNLQLQLGGTFWFL